MGGEIPSPPSVDQLIFNSCFPSLFSFGVANYLKILVIKDAIGRNNCSVEKQELSLK
jgi:hypothetical protein